MTASGVKHSAAAHASAPVPASRTCQRSPVRVWLNRCRKLESQLASSAVRARTRDAEGDAGRTGMGNVCT